MKAPYLVRDIPEVLNDPAAEERWPQAIKALEFLTIEDVGRLVCPNRLDPFSFIYSSTVLFTSFRTWHYFGNRCVSLQDSYSHKINVCDT